MKLNKNPLLILIFLAVFLFNLYVSLNFNYFFDSTSYFNLRVIEHIASTGLPLLYDPLGYSGVDLAVPQLFHYLVGIFFFIPFYFKIIPALFASSIVFVVYLLSKEVTKNEYASLLTSFLSGFVPIYFIRTVNNVSIYSLMVPLIFWLFYFLIKIEQKKYLKLFLLFSFLLPFAGASSFLFVFSLIFYVILNVTENIKIAELKKEAILFSFFVVLLINLILFKKAFFMQGFDVIYGNVPRLILENYFRSFNIFNSIYLIGVFSFFFGIVGVYYGLKEKSISVILFISLILSTLLLLFLKLININVGLLFLAMGLTVISSLALNKFFIYLNKTKLSNFKNYFMVFFVLLVIIFALLPSYYSSQNVKNLEVFEWMKNNLEEGSVVLAPPGHGHYITSLAEKKNVMDSNFLLVDDADDRFNSVSIIYNTWSETKALELLREYKVNYIYVNNMSEYNLNFLDDEKCFERIREEIYKVKC